MTSLCEICGPENDCTCGGCQCMWCRYHRGDDLSPMEVAQIKAHERALKAYEQRIADRAMLDASRKRWGQ